MKRQILTLGAICAAAFTLTNCNKEIAEPKAPVTEGIPFEIVAATADTKTANEGPKTVWAAGDALTVFHAEAGSTAYGNNDKFTYAGADNKFKGTLETGLDASKSYDWYALYPYSSYIKTPTNSDRGGYVYIGERSDQTQIQTGNDSKAHLIYGASNQTGLRNCPLYAVSKDVAASATPTFTMKQLASIVEVNVTNPNDAPLTVSTVSFTAPAGTNIVGTFYVNFTDNGKAVYTDGDHPGNIANLTVKNGTAIAKDGVAKFYLAIKPFAANISDELKISVNGYEKTHKLTKNVEFKAGKIEAVNFKYDKAIAAETLVAKFVATEIGNGYKAHEGVTSDGKNWTVTFGQQNYVGTNKSKKANCKLGAKYEKVGKPCGYTADQTMVAAIISESALANVSKVVVNGDSDTNNPEKISLVYSTDGTTYSLIETKTYSKAGNEFTFAKKASAYYAVVLYHKGGGTDIFMRTRDLVVSFYE